MRLLKILQLPGRLVVLLLFGGIASVQAQITNVTIEGGVTAITQDESDTQRSDTLSFDLVSEIPAGTGHWLVYVEANNSLHDDTVASMYEEANGDAGSALDRDGKGRFQVSEFHYVWQYNESTVIAAGLLDATGWLDASAVANDETSQFLVSSLVVNPGIEFPDYTLGGVYHSDLGNGTGLTFMLASSHGLADSENASYSELFDVSDEGKGIFSAVEGQWQNDGLDVLAGVWLSTADHEELNGIATDKSNYGVYLSADLLAEQFSWNLRLGIANDDVAQTAQFASVAFEYAMESNVLGVGYAHSKLSDKDITADLDDASQAEVYVRFDLDKNISVSPSLQWLKNSGFDASNTVIDDSVTIVGVRVNLIY